MTVTSPGVLHIYLAFVPHSSEIMLIFGGFLEMFTRQINQAMRKHSYIILILAITCMSFASDKPAYRLFDQEGKKVKYEKMLKELVEADIVFFGELHTDPIAHWLQLELTKDLYEQKREALVLGAEMFEADNQLILNEYLEGIYASDKFEAEMRLWGNYQTDYKPLVEFARKNHVPFIATNIPRRYASVVHKKGFEGLDELDDEALDYIAPLPILYDPEVKCYKDMLNMVGLGAPEEEEAPMGMAASEEKEAAEETEAPKMMPAGHGSGIPKNTMENLPKAQAAKDATMAYFILENWTEGKTMFHFNGTYHSDNFEGIVWHLKQQNPELKIMTIATVQQTEIDSLSEKNQQLASYILCVPENMTRTRR
jgi:uncharacterized iron-regulated protein